MVIKKKFKVLCLLFILCPSISFAATLYCPKNFSEGTYTGHLTDVIDKNDSSYTFYILETTDGEKGCVKNTAQHPARNKLISNAFLLNNLVVVSLDSNHVITGIGYRNDE